MDLLVLMISSVLSFLLCFFVSSSGNLSVLFLGVWSLILVLWKSTCTVNYLLTYREKDKDYLKHALGCLVYFQRDVYDLVWFMLE